MTFAVFVLTTRKMTAVIMLATTKLSALTCVTATDANGQRAGGAEGGRTTVNYQDGQEVHVLLMAIEA